jgi:translation initiation factor 5B
MTQLQEQGLNSEVYFRNRNVLKVVSLIPCSAMTGEGIPDLLAVLVQLTQRAMESRLRLSDELAATVLEVKQVEGLGTTIDVILVNGTLHEGDRIMLCGMDCAIETEIRALLTPQPLREMRVKVGRRCRGSGWAHC